MSGGVGSYFKGTSESQDVRFGNKEKKLLKAIKFPSEFDKSVDLKKVELPSIKPWIHKRITELLSFEDEILENMVITMMETSNINNPLCPKKMQINLTGFLESNAPIFMKELWNLLLSAQESEGGIPQQLIEETKKELISKKKTLEDAKEQMTHLKGMIKKIDKEAENTGKLESSTKKEQSQFHLSSSKKFEHWKHHDKHSHHHRKNSSSSSLFSSSSPQNSDDSIGSKRSRDHEIKFKDKGNHRNERSKHHQHEKKDNIEKIGKIGKSGKDNKNYKEDKDNQKNIEHKRTTNKKYIEKEYKEKNNEDRKEKNKSSSKKAKRRDSSQEPLPIPENPWDRDNLDYQEENRKKQALLSLKNSR